LDTTKIDPITGRSSSGDEVGNGNSVEKAKGFHEERKTSPEN